jgi:hypothetical protein
MIGHVSGTGMSITETALTGRLLKNPDIAQNPALQHRACNGLISSVDINFRFTRYLEAWIERVLVARSSNATAWTTGDGLLMLSKY